MYSGSTGSTRIRAEDQKRCALIVIRGDEQGQSYPCNRRRCASIEAELARGADRAPGARSGRPRWRSATAQWDLAAIDQCSRAA